MISQENQQLSPWRLSVAPMMDWTDRHCRYFHRLITRNTLLYTEMVTTGALLHGNQPRHLDFSDEEHPVALQLGGSEPDALAACARLAQQWGYDEVNLNCGCPSERVQRGAFGACPDARGRAGARQRGKAMRVGVRAAGDRQAPHRGRSSIGELRLRARLRGHRRPEGGCDGLHRACPQCVAGRPESEGQPHDPATALRDRAIG